MNRTAKGRSAETKIVQYLSSRGFKILGRNYTIRGGEIDIIARKDEAIVFVEVKSLQSEKYIALHETISERKKNTLIRACRYWLWDNKMEDIDWRIDFIGIVLDAANRIKKLKHLENAIGYF